MTWDSARTNSFFYLRLPFALGRQDDFELSFDLQLAHIQGGVSPEKPSTFEIAVGFIHVASATGPAFNRGTGRDSPNLVEFAYFPPADIIAATVSPVIVTSNSQFWPSFNYPVELTVGDRFRVGMAFRGGTGTLTTGLLRNGVAWVGIRDVVLGTNGAGFRIDAVSVNSYNDRGDPWGSVWARGVVDNVIVAWPDPPRTRLAGAWDRGVWHVACASTGGWSYALERAAPWPHWQTVAGPRPGTGGELRFEDESPPPNGAFYRVRLERP
ncbi:MAG: hypothetical protein JXQ71_02410 [Verrucomicrobia bacterium]|nr:hypothetical protein [Verrucomicrobiota bacterium]